MKKIKKDYQTRWKMELKMLNYYIKDQWKFFSMLCDLSTQSTEELS